MTAASGQAELLSRKADAQKSWTPIDQGPQFRNELRLGPEIRAFRISNHDHALSRIHSRTLAGPLKDTIRSVKCASLLPFETGPILFRLENA
jgi:hypothetical protein